MTGPTGATGATGVIGPTGPTGPVDPNASIIDGIYNYNSIGMLGPFPPPFVANTTVNTADSYPVGAFTLATFTPGTYKVRVFATFTVTIALGQTAATIIALIDGLPLINTVVLGSMQSQ